MAEFIELLGAFAEEENWQREVDYYRTAWLASHIMNSSGNYRKTVTPDILLGKSKATQRKITPEEKQQVIHDLKIKFGQ